MSFSIATEAYGPGTAITLSSPLLQVTLCTLGASVRNVLLYLDEEEKQHVPTAEATGEQQPQKHGKWTEVNVHHCDAAEADEDTASYFGATVGRFAGRIGHAQFSLPQQHTEAEAPSTVFHTDKNQSGEHTLHGGFRAFDKKQWSFETIENEKEIAVRFAYLSPHLENGFPADLQCYVSYTIHKAQPRAFETAYDAFIPETSPADATIANLFNHCYWNLNGVPENNLYDEKTESGQQGTSSSSKRGKKLGVREVFEHPRSIKNHVLTLQNAASMIDTVAAGLTSGKILPLDTVDPIFDFRHGKPLGDGIHEAGKLQRDPSGFDHPYLITGYNKQEKKLQLNAEITSPETNIRMSVYSTFPVIWVYTANHLPENANGTRGQRHRRHDAFCLEPQNPPDAANHKEAFHDISDVFITKSHPYKEKFCNVFSVDGAVAARLSGVL